MSQTVLSPCDKLTLISKESSGVRSRKTFGWVPRLLLCSGGLCSMIISGSDWTVNDER